MRLNFDVPKGWTFPTLDKLTPPKKGAIKIGPFGSSLKKAEYSESGIRVLGIDHVYSNELVWKKPKYIPPAKYEELTQYTVQTGDVLVTNMGTVGRTCFVPDNLPTAIISSHLIKVSPDFSKIEPSYLCWALNFCPVVVAQIRAKCQGAIMAGFNTSLLKSLHIPLPPLEEQRRITAILDKADAVRRKRKEAIALTEQFLRSAFLEMFGDPLTNPKGWEIVEFGTVTESKLGKMLSKESRKGVNPVRYLGNTHVRWRSFDLIELPEMDFSEAELLKLDLRDGDLIVCEGGEVGRCAIWKNQLPKISFQKALHRVRCKTTQVLPEYLQEYFFWMAERGGLQSSTSSATIAHLTGVRLKQLPLPLPPISQQKVFQQVYATYEHSKQQYQKALSEQDNLFNSLLQRAFRGEL